MAACHAAGTSRRAPRLDRAAVPLRGGHEAVGVHRRGPGVYVGGTTWSTVLLFAQKSFRTCGVFYPLCPKVDKVMRLAKKTDNCRQLARLALSVLQSDIACTSGSPRSEEPAFFAHAIKKIGRLMASITASATFGHST